VKISTQAATERARRFAIYSAKLGPAFACVNFLNDERNHPLS